jgi:uncharacterized membrane protein
MTFALCSLTRYSGWHEIGLELSRLNMIWSVRIVRCRLLRRPEFRAAAVALLLTMFGLVALPDEALADFRLCNNTGSRVGIAVGYKDGDGWITEGWWNLSSRTCETILRGPLVARFYYIYAIDYDRGGEWSGKAFMCTRDKEFTIRGIDDCLARGFERAGFFEVDTIEQRSWTVQLTESAEQAPTRPLQPQVPASPAAPDTRARGTTPAPAPQTSPPK